MLEQQPTSLGFFFPQHSAYQVSPDSILDGVRDCSTCVKLILFPLCHLMFQECLSPTAVEESEPNREKEGERRRKKEREKEEGGGGRRGSKRDQKPEFTLPLNFPEQK